MESFAKIKRDGKIERKTKKKEKPDVKGPLPNLHPGNLQLQLEKGTERFTRLHLFFFILEWEWDLSLWNYLCTFLSFTLPCQQKLTRD